jgi:hypothetical protein
MFRMMPFPTVIVAQGNDNSKGISLLPWFSSIISPAVMLVSSSPNSCPENEGDGIVISRVSSKL